MIDQNAIEAAIVNGLKDYVSTPEIPCEVVMANQVAPIPPYPYIAYTVTTMKSGGEGTYSVDINGTRYKSVAQTWSFTVQSDDDAQCKAIASKANDYFDFIARTELTDSNIVVVKVGNISNRDNLITVEYEHRNGFDVTFSVLQTITKETAEKAEGVIETVEFRSPDVPPIRI